MMKKYIFKVKPVSEPRQSRRDSWAPRKNVLAYRAFKDWIRYAAKENGFVLTDSLKFKFYLPIPEYLKNYVTEETPHKIWPDVHNLVKAFLDAFNKDDSFVWRVSAEKRYSKQPRIEVDLYDEKED